ncbi:hypothetical protein LL033_17460 [Clostridium estertheticum]|uniref:hypothetical protein n=1 Tax=Clostridium estertheticum TaxID=238834 RepID=UPI001C0E2487|nr:hypothetical protein [Clostridium estertheticum]MBU3216643.1 hypothetical protein [Clostridium estertheticum]WAG54402.1 hypothetical protein LL033_17460 [Clostridium estertheticum]
MEKSSFFNSVAGDRKYKASNFADYFNSLLTNGVFPNPSTNLQVINNNNMTITVKTGKAWINGYQYFNDGDLTLPIAIADGVLNRIDRIVVRFDTVGRLISTVVKSGTMASVPVAPVLQRDADLFELGIADIYIGQGAVLISQPNITDLRMNTTLCGWVNSLIQADTSAIFNQYQDWYNAKQTAYNSDFTTWTTAKKATYNSWYATTTSGYITEMSASESSFQEQFNTWFSAIQSQLSGDIAGNLQIQITEIPKVYKGTIAPTTPKSLDFWFKQV